MTRSPAVVMVRSHQQVFRWERGMSLSTVARRFSHAALVFGPHGGAFLNMIFCPTGSSDHSCRSPPVKTYPLEPRRLPYCLPLAADLLAGPRNYLENRHAHPLLLAVPLMRLRRRHYLSLLLSGPQGRASSKSAIGIVSQWPTPPTSSRWRGGSVCTSL